MKLIEAKDILEKIPNVPFGTLFTNEQLCDVIKNKGKIGQLLETIILKLNLSNNQFDFEDGELKSGCFYTDGTPKETIAVCMISSIIDDLINTNDYTQSYPYQKMSNMIIAEVGKYRRKRKEVLPPEEWAILNCIHVNCFDEKYITFFEQINKDLQNIFTTVKYNIENGKDISTTNGKYIQIRTKDSGGSHPIFSKHVNRFISHSNYAIYITKAGIEEILRIEGEL